MEQNRKYKYMVAIVILAFTITLGIGLASCGGGGGSTPPPQPPDTYIFYHDASHPNGSPRGGLYAFDPAAPTDTPIEVEAPPANPGVGLQSALEVYVSGTFHSSDKSITEAHIRTVMYAKGGNLYKVSALKSDGTPTPVQVSNESGVTSDLCDNLDIPDFSDHDRSLFLYVLPGQTLPCTGVSDEVKVVRLNMTSTDAPIAVSGSNLEFMKALYDRSTAAIVGVIARNSATNKLVECDANFANCTDLPLATVLSAGDLGSDRGSNRAAFWAYNGTNYTVHTYDFVLDLTSTVIGTLTGEPSSDFLTEGRAVYFADGSVLKKLAFGTGTTLSTVVDETGNTFSSGTLTSDRLVYIVNGTVLKSVLKDGTDPKTLLDVSASAQYYGGPVIPYGSRVYYNYLDNGGAWHAGWILDSTQAGTNNSSNEVANSAWTSMSVVPTLMQNEELTASRLVRQDTSNGELRSFDPATYMTAGTGTMLGTMPSQMAFTGYGLGRHIVGEAADPANGNNRDVFYVDVLTGNSLVRITTTGTIDEDVL